MASPSITGFQHKVVVGIADLSPDTARTNLARVGWQAERNLGDMCRDAWKWQNQNPNGYQDAN